MFNCQPSHKWDGNINSLLYITLPLALANGIIQTGETTLVEFKKLSTATSLVLPQVFHFMPSATGFNAIYIFRLYCPPTS